LKIEAFEYLIRNYLHSHHKFPKKSVYNIDMVN